jgi:23S rRNA (uracil1939-C5)-methyltransferase
LRPGDELDIDFTDILANGQGVGRALGVVVFCFGPLTGERARVRIVTMKPRYAVGEMLALLRESPARAVPFCPVFGVCGGCQLQHLAYDAQLAWKRDVVRNALTRIGDLGDVAVNETIGMAHPRAYRNKMSLVVDHASKPPALGFYRQRSHEVVPIEACPIVAPPLDALLRRLLALRAKPVIERMLGVARHLVARCARAGEQAVLTVTTPARMSDAQAGPAIRDALAVGGVGNSFDLSSANAILGRHHQWLAGDEQIEETIGGLTYRISTASFFQVNVEILAKIFDFITPWLERPGSIVDLYCGAGTFSLFFARHGWSVVGVEENRHAIAEAQANASFNGLQERARFEAGSVEQMLALERVRRIVGQADVVFLDPPRKGCDEAVLDAIAAARVRTIWYLSCDAATLARDSKFLLSKGYRLDVVQPFDMFPQTGHVESLVRLELSET